MSSPLLTSAFIVVFSMSAISQVVAAPIHHAARTGDLAAVEQLIDDGANIDAKDPLGTALHHAVAAGHAEVIELLLFRGADVNAMSGTGSPLHLAILSDRATIVERLIAVGANVNATVGEGNTPLHYAAQAGSVALAKLLIENGADVKARRVRSGMPLHDAIVGEHTDLAELLIENGAGPPKIDPVTPLLATANINAGKAAALNCNGCHSLEREGEHGEGPNLWNVVGRPMAGAANFAYSSALTEADGIWGYEELNEFIAHPRALIPGSKMEYQTINDEQTRADIILYLRRLSDDPASLS